MTRRATGVFLVGLAFVALIVAMGLRLTRDTQNTEVNETARTEHFATIERYCTDCHNNAELAGGTSFEGAAIQSLSEDPDLWETAVRKLRGGFMPPPGEPHPGAATVAELAAWIETERDQAWAAAPSPGAPVLHRLNRAEYANAVADLLHIEFDATGTLPADDSSAGFDNIASALSVSPALMQAYVSAAARISRTAVGDPSISPGGTTYTVPRDVSQDAHMDGLPLGTRGGLLVDHVFPLDAEYEIRVSRSGSFFGLRNVGSEDPVALTLNGETVATLSPATGNSIVLSIPAGPQRIGAAMLAAGLHRGVNDLYSEWADSTGVTAVSILGPLNPSGAGDTPSRRRLFICEPESAAAEPACAREILSNTATRAWRRPVEPDEDAVNTLMDFYADGHALRGFEGGIQYALARILVDPQFIFRFEAEPEDLAEGGVYELGDYELASRLAFFLWSSIPDDELLDAAGNGNLAEASGRQTQIERMLAHPRSAALVENFAGQWFGLRALASVLPETNVFDGNLRSAFRRETEMLFAHIVENDLSIFELLDADYTFVDERLARHYGIPNIRGSRFRRVELDDDARRGILGHGSFLTVTSAPNRTSPVIRGAWVLENLLGTPAPDPPPGVETDLDQVAAAAAGPETLRARLERHREDPSCGACHALIDPIGFALENFDPIGAWRESDEGHTIDASTTLWDGTPIAGPGQLREALYERRDMFALHATEKLLTYALGRPVEAADMPAVREIVRRARDADYRFSAIVLGIVESVPFRMKVKRAQSLVSN